jgi:hypothetical protein
MATFRLRRFSNPEVLRAIAPRRLIAFLEPHRAFFEARGLVFPRAPSTGPIDYEALVDLFMDPGAGLPKDLLDALFLVDEMATPHGMDALLNTPGLSLEESDEDSPADIAVQTWLLDRQLLESKHAEQFLVRPRSFECYQTGRAKVPPFTLPAPAVCGNLERDLDDWFEAKKRGRGTRVFVYPREDGVWFLVRHGEPFQRAESLNGSETASICYRPLKYDVLVYQPEIGELRINACSKGEKRLYRVQFGRHLFGDEDFFPGDSKYTLDPLLTRGEAALSCVDVTGMERVLLREVHFLLGGPSNEVEVHRAEDVFEAFRSRGGKPPDGARIIRAVFQVKFADSKRPRSVTIRPSNIAQYTRDDDAELVEQWLRRRGFILPGANAGKGVGHATLASA